MRSAFSFLILFMVYILLSPKTGKAGTSGGTINVKHLGFDGTWDEFCDYNKIEEEFGGFLDHDVKRNRILVCHLRNQDQILPESMPAFVVYKYCLAIKSNLEEIYLELVDKYNLKNVSNRIEEAFEENTDADTCKECFNKSMDTFHTKCIGKKNPCVRMFRTILHIVCNNAKISEEDIGRHLEDVCDGKYISDKINWNLYSLSISLYNA